MLRLILKLFVVPFALVLTIATALFSFILSMSDKIFCIASSLAFLISVGLFITGQPAGGIAFIVVAFLVSPFGLPVLAGWFVKGLDGAGGLLRSFLVS